MPLAYDIDYITVITSAFPILAFIVSLLATRYIPCLLLTTTTSPSPILSPPPAAVAFCYFIACLIVR